MSRSANSFDPSEPRKPELAANYRFPVSKSPMSDLFAILAMGCSGLAMLTKQPLWSWLGVWLSIAAMRVTKDLNKESATDRSSSLSPWSSLLFSLTAITSTYLPLLTGMADKAPLSFQSIFSLNRGLIMKALPQAATTAAAAS